MWSSDEFRTKTAILKLTHAAKVRIIFYEVNDCSTPT